MKPIIVEMQAFGPFAHRQVIDFRELGSKTFFLIHGPTGSGKTSILDGICFALFGDSSGGEREGRQMRSHHADSDTLTEVRFDFALGTGRYRVRRVPEQVRKSRRGGGETKQNQTADLWRIDTRDGKEIEQPIASGWSKVTDKIVALLGFESRQFRQVIMLPQGKFFEFLKSNSQEREKILQTLFGTELYKRIEEALKLSANDLSREADKVRTQRQTLLDQAKTESEVTLDVRRQEQADDLKSREGAEQRSAAAAQAAEKALAEARQSADRFAEFDAASAALQTLLANQPTWAGQRTRLASARLASSIRPYETVLADLGKQLAEEVGRGKTLAKDLLSAIEIAKAADTALGRERTRAPETEKAIARIAELDALVGKVATLATARTEHAAVNAESVKAAEAMKAAQNALMTATGKQRTLVTEVQNHRVHAAGAEGLREVHTRLTTQLEQGLTLAEWGRELAKSAMRVEAGNVNLKAAQTALAETKDRRNRTHQAWIAGQAARLAVELLKGEPCPVCGAHDHPVPARAEGELVLDDTLNVAEDAFAKAEATHREAEQKLAMDRQAGSVLEARITDIRVALGETAQVPTAQLKAQADAALSTLTQAQAAANALKDVDARLGAAESAVKTNEATAKSAETAAQQLQAKLHITLGQLNEREAGVPPDLADPKALQIAQVAAGKTRVALKQALDEAMAAANQATDKLAGSKARAEASELARAQLANQQLAKTADFDQRIKAAGFANADTYREARIDAAAMTELDASIMAFDTALGAAGERHTRAEAGTRDLLRPDLAQLLATHDAAKATQLGASNAVRDAMAALATTTGFAESLKQLAESFKSLEDRFAVLKQVADVASGVNPQRMSFQRYVLATLLEEVLASTTIRLRVMSRGRYEMHRKVEPGDQRTHAGLDLEIFDQYTGTRRPVSTLSGGESFLASLALALGLSDVVQSYAGGIRLDAIFVDEGFGTLDPEALDFAIRALKDLQQAGRMVGIISHVAELKEWIDARLELKATQTGSVATFVQ